MHTCAGLGGAPGAHMQPHAATAAHRDGCTHGQYQLVLPDIEQPLRMPLGGRGEEAPAAPCFPMPERPKAAGKPVDCQVRPEASRARDKQGLRARGDVCGAQVTRAAAARTLAFFAAAR